MKKYNTSPFFLFNCLNPMINAFYFFFFFVRETQKVAFNWKTFHRLQFVRCSLSPPEHDCSLIHGVKQPPILSPGFFQFRVNIPPSRILFPIILSPSSSFSLSFDCPTFFHEIALTGLTLPRRCKFVTSL